VRSRCEKGKSLSMSRPKRPNRKKQDLRTLITQKAGELFGKGGYHGATVEQISKSLGISKPRFYYHFASKEEILFEFSRFAHNKALEGLKRITTGSERAVIQRGG